tara:strand:- start:660 stop:1472 length:813 start_codon:yes stop_codon:yes gene_type:complete
MKNNFDFNLNRNNTFFLISGPCVIENEELNLKTAEKLKEVTDKLKIPFIYKSSLDKANRTSHNSYRGVGYTKGLEILNKIKKELDVHILTDVHEDSPLDEISEIADVLQTPAFLCRQTNFIKKVASYNLPVNIKKGQFLSPWEMSSVVEKAKSTGNKDILVCERGFSFGYNNLISDMRSLIIMRDTGCPVIFDATHSTQLPGFNKNSSGGQSEFIEPLAKAAMSVGISGIFMETHPNPKEALSDGMNSIPLNALENLLIKLKKIDQITKE